MPASIPHWSNGKGDCVYSAYNNCKFCCSMAQSCPIRLFVAPMDCNPPGSSVYGILCARIQEWVAMPFSRRSSQPRDQTQVSHIAAGFFTVWATREFLIHYKGANSLSNKFIHIWKSNEISAAFKKNYVGKNLGSSRQSWKFWANIESVFYLIEKTL